MNLIQLNKFSELHDDKKIFFCKTDFIFDDFEKIKSLDNEVILITGNSDYPITEHYLNHLPSNVKVWFAQNSLCNHPKLIPIPIGIENKLESVRHGHGVGYYDRVSIKENLLNRNLTRITQKKIYSNFDITTNKSHRIPVKSVCENSSHIDWEDPNLKLEEFFNKILDYRMVVCPAGNGIDTHRLWEVLYSNRIPITIKMGDFKIYELYKKLPIIILDKIEDLSDIDLIEKKYSVCSDNIKNYYILDYEYWKNFILDFKKSI